MAKNEVSAFKRDVETATTDAFLSAGKFMLTITIRMRDDEKDLVIVVPNATDELKDAIADKIRAVASNAHVVAICVAAESWFARGAADDRRPRDREDRQEGILLLFETPDGDGDEMVLIEIERDENGVSLGRRRSMLGPSMGGRFAGLLRPLPQSSESGGRA